MTSSALYDKDTQALFWNNNTTAIQRMLDYDYFCRRNKPSIAAIVHPTGEASFQKFFFGASEILVPIYSSTTKAMENHPEINTLLNFASFRTAFDVTMESLQFEQIKSIMVTAEGIPERLARLMNYKAKKAGKILIGPSTVGAISPGFFKIANIGGSEDNIIRCKLTRPGSIGLVTRSGGLFNELCNIIAMNSNGIAEGVAVGGDRYPGTTFIDHFLRMEKNPAVTMHILLGEVGGTDEYQVIEAVKNGQIKKPMVGWCIGTVAEHLSSGVQFGHAGAKANSDQEKAASKNQAMKEAGITVPETFNDFPSAIKSVYEKVAKANNLVDEPVEVPELPENYSALQKAGKARKGTNFICTISDDRGEEAVYAGIPISSVALPETGYSIGDVISLLWFKKRYPKWATDFLETVIKTVADHGPAVSGAHNTKVTARAGKDVLTSVVTGLLTIGPRFGGAIDGAAKYFKYGSEQELSPKDFLAFMKKEGIPIPGIGHRIKSIKNPDLRVSGLKKYAAENFPKTDTLNYALEVEQETTSKKGTLILNVDGTIGVLMVDMWKALKYSNLEIDKMIQTGMLNALFAVGRMIGFIGHALDEKRLNMAMYRHELSDILYDVKLAETID